MKTTLRTLAIALLALILSLTPCMAEDNPSTTVEYAVGFTVESLSDGCRMVRDAYGNAVLVVPEGATAPEAEDGVQVLRLPVTSSYICGSNMVAMADAIGVLDRVTMVGTNSAWHFQGIIDQLDSGATRFIGGYTTDLDYEALAEGDAQLVVMNGYEEDVFEKFRALGICAIAEENTNEPNLYARLEWMKCLGVLYGAEEAANAYFDDQIARIEAIRGEEPTGLVVGMGGYSTSSGKCFARKSGDFQADYIRYAGGTYNLQDVNPDQGGSLDMTAEDFYLRFKDCDVVIWSMSIGEEETLEALAEVYPSIVDFKAWQNDQIYIQADKYIQTGAQDPACIVRDIHEILTSDDPAVTTDHIVRLFHAE